MTRFRGPGFCAVTLALVLGSNACAATASNEASDSFRAAASTIAGIDRTIDDANTDYFIAATLAAGDPVTASQKCIRPDTTTGTRATPLTSPAFPPAAIEQRETLIRVLEAYQALRVAVANDGAELAIPAADYQAALARMKAAATVHGPGDLFVDEAATSLDPADTASSVKALTKKLGSWSDRGELEKLLAAQRPTIAKLIVIAFDDASANRLQAESATANVAGEWQAYASSAARAKLAPTAGTIGAAGNAKTLPSCNEPWAAAAAAAPPATAIDQTTALSPAMWAKIDVATRRHQTMVALNEKLGSYFAALTTVNETSNEDATALQAAFNQFASAAQQLADTGAELR